MSATRTKRTNGYEEAGRTERELLRAHELMIDGEEIEVRRLPMKQVFALMRLVKEGPLGDLINISQGQLPIDSMKRVASVADPDERRAALQEEIGKLDASPAAMMGLFIDAEDSIYRILALALGRDVEWIGEHVGLADFVRTLAVVGRQELVDTDFFGAVRDVNAIWGQAATATGRTTETLTDGSGESSPS